MQIITIEDHDFPELLSALQEARIVGRYVRGGKVQIVKINNRFMMVSPADDPQKIAIRPARSLTEAEQLALAYLEREELRGTEVERQVNK